MEEVSARKNGAREGDTRGGRREHLPERPMKRRLEVVGARKNGECAQTAWKVFHYFFLFF